LIRERGRRRVAMKFETAADLYFIVAVFVPGFVFDAVLSKFVPRHSSTLRELVLLRLLTATAFNYAVCSPVIYLLVTGALFANSPWWQGLTWSVVIFVVPIVLALIVAKASQKGFLALVARKLRLRSINPIPTGWDWIFSRTAPCYLLVTLRDGAEVAGYFGGQSMASSDRDRKDLYLERVFVVPARGPWRPIEPPSGIYIEGSQIAFIEFRPGE
jgi:Family of unknown function (DUF6338)